MREELINKGILVQYPSCYLLRQAMPYPLATSNSYLVEVDNGWAVIDVGVDLPSTRELWQAVIDALGMDWQQINAIYITHCHPDHLGAAAWMQRMSEAPVFMLAQEIERAQSYIFLNGNYGQSYLQVTASQMELHSFDQDKRQRLAIDWQDAVRPLYPEPEWLLPFFEGDDILLHGSLHQIIKLPGHTDGQVGFWSRENRQLFSADLAAVQGNYLHFTDWPNTRNDNPLGDLLNTLERLELMEISAMLPGHGLMITSPHQAFDALRSRHQAQLQHVQELITTPRSATELYHQMIRLRDEEYIHYHRVCLGEALGYMRYLEAQGQAKSYREDGVLKFIRV